MANVVLSSATYIKKRERGRPIQMCSTWKDKSPEHCPPLYLLIGVIYLSTNNINYYLTKIIYIEMCYGALQSKKTHIVLG
jgi:hypothetical protein